LGKISLNEVVELIAVLFVGAGKYVGSYLNNAADLAYNAGGAIIAAIIIAYKRLR